MKPVRLKFSGLQSYREEQEVNFEELGRMGTFGIFGPTGSGKSTILDAITLALFGKVERAKGGTRGIINQSSNSVFVSFEFVLGNECYMVERLYSRDKHDYDSVKIKNVRLLNTTLNRVLASGKVSEVDEKITEILGMSFDNFTRAVVLPQGKFDQFLKLTGGDRARMLENIFCLDRYGENLWKKASIMVENLQNEIHTNQKLIDQLGDASQEAIEKTEKQLQTHRELVNEKRKALLKAEKRVEEARKLADMYKQIDTLEKNLQVLKTQRPIMEKEKDRLVKAQKAEPLRSLVEQLNGLLQREKKESLKVAEQEQIENKLAQKLEVLDKRLNEAKEGEKELNRLKEYELPRVSLAMEHEKQLLNLERELKVFRGEAEVRKEVLDRVSREGTEKGTVLKGIKNEITKISARQQELKGILSCREETEKCLNALIELETAERQEKETRDILKKREEALAREKNRLREVLKVNLQLSEEDIKMGSIQTLVDRAARVVEEARAEQEKAEKRMEEARLRDMAGLLSRNITEGEPCPVCGSTKHPNPAIYCEHDKNEVEAAREELQKAKDNLEKLRRWQNEVNIIHNTFETVMREIENVYRPNFNSKSLISNEKKKIFSMYYNDFIQKTAKFWEHGDIGLSEAAKTVRDVKHRIDKAEQEYETLGQKIEALREQEGGLEEDISKLREKYQDVRAEKNSLENNIRTYENQIAALKARIKEITGGYTPSEFKEMIQKKINALQKEISEAQNEWEKTRDRFQEIKRQLAGLKAALNSTNEHILLIEKNLEKGIRDAGFKDYDDLLAAFLEEGVREQITKSLEKYNHDLNHTVTSFNELREQVKNRPFNNKEYEEANKLLLELKKQYEELVMEEGAMIKHLSDLKEKHIKWQELKKENESLTRRRGTAQKLVTLLKGRRFVQFLAEERLRDMAIEASLRLGVLTGQRYSLELDEGCAFIMRDNYSGSQLRPVNTLSGGETFLTSLSLALALSSKIQLKGQYPLGFFFLDEGFGTLDPEKLDIVMNTLERLHDGHRMVGVITHVPEFKNRVPRYLEVMPAREDGTGSRVLLKMS